MFKHTLSVLTILLVLCAQGAQAQAQGMFITDDDLARFVKDADLIIEGEVDMITGEVAKTVPNYVGQGRQQIMLDFGTVAAIDFAVDQSLKGVSKEGKRIRIYAKPDFTGSFQTLLPNRKYLLFLKKHRFKKGYEVMDKGRLEWTVFDYEGTRKVKSSSQLPQYRPMGEYLDYEELIRQISAHLTLADPK